MRHFYSNHLTKGWSGTLQGNAASTVGNLLATQILVSGTDALCGHQDS